MSFSRFKFLTPIEQAIKKSDYIKPSKIQEEVIPLVLDKKDVIAKAQTGSGKTASFVLPILNLWLQKEQPKKAKITTLVLTPTRDLSVQVTKAFEQFSQCMSCQPKVVSIIGGDGIGDQLLDIQKGCDIVVATPGRLLDILNKKQMDLSALEFFVLDEADKMLDLGFAQELDLVLENLPKNRVNLLFSATYSSKMLEISSRISSNPIEVSIDSEELIVQNIHQRAIDVNSENRSALLKSLLKRYSWKKVLVFMAKKRACDNLANKFVKQGFEAESFHGDLIQDERNDTLDDFKQSNIEVLFCTDIAARGLHIDDIEAVINYDLPRSTNDYIHRIGRTARAGKSGVAISFITHENSEHFELIKKRCHLDVKKEVIVGFELTGVPPVNIKGKEPIKGKRKSKKDKLREQQNQKEIKTQ